MREDQDEKEDEHKDGKYRKTRRGKISWSKNGMNGGEGDGRILWK